MAIKHIVLIKFKEDVSDEQINDCFFQLANLKQVLAILSFKRIKYNSNEGLNQDFIHGFEMEFSDEVARDQYLNSEMHGKVAKNIIQYIHDFPRGLIAFDYSF
jgi:hypothetical protein